MPKIDLASTSKFQGSTYPPPFEEPCRGRSGIRLGAAANLTQFGVNLMTLAPGVPDGHHLQNRTEADATFLVVGTRNDEDHGEYSDIDMAFGPGRYTGRKTARYRHKDGSPY